mmetsp:Transcript_15976/g.60898  ORF Transcript_15976/g.60898 Transcript_15976/m.60898 type:complete len:228 (-) Transcript_15976:153-836(-)
MAKQQRKEWVGGHFEALFEACALCVVAARGPEDEVAVDEGAHVLVLQHALHERGRVLVMVAVEVHQQEPARGPRNGLAEVKKQASATYALSVAGRQIRSAVESAVEAIRQLSSVLQPELGAEQSRRGPRIRGLLVRVGEPVQRPSPGSQDAADQSSEALVWGLPSKLSALRLRSGVFVGRVVSIVGQHVCLCRHLVDAGQIWRLWRRVEVPGQKRVDRGVQIPVVHL